MYDAIILGGGPAGLSAAVYLARQKVKFLLLTQVVGGYALMSQGIENYLGFHLLNGLELVKRFKEHLRDYEGMFDLKEGEVAESVEEIPGGFKIKTKKGEYETRSLLVATGTRHRELGVPGEREFLGKGVSYCAVCDAPLFKDKTVYVIGGGNSAMSAASFLEKYAAQIRVVTVNAGLKGDTIMKSKVEKSPKVQILPSTKTVRIEGGERVTGIVLSGPDGQEKRELADGVFIEIGLEPRSAAIGLVEKDKWKQILVDKHNRTSREGIFAAGDVTDVTEKQIAVAVGEGSKAALALIDWLERAAVVSSPATLFEISNEGGVPPEAG